MHGRAHGQSPSLLLKGREGRSPQGSCFNKRLFPKEGKAGERGRGAYLKLPCCSRQCSLARRSLAVPDRRAGLGSSW